MAAKYPHVTVANKYARDVVSGRIPACAQNRQACQRHLDELQASKKTNYPYRFSKDKAERICRFVELQVHVRGKWRGAPIVLEPWQKFTLAVPFGWVRKSDGLRRFREMYVEIARKNAKSTGIAAVIGLYMAFADGELGAEVYAAATTEEQAFEVFRTAWLMVELNPGFKNRFNLSLAGTENKPGNIYDDKGNRFATVVGKPKDGASPHGWLQDEYHESKTSESFDTGKTGMGARPQPMLAVTTTAGTNTSYPCYDKRRQIERILSGEIVNDTIFGIIFTIDPEDDWTDFKNWRKANPNMGVSVFEDYLKDQLNTAMQDARKQNIILCKHLNIWSNAGVSAFNMVNWEKCGDLLPSDIADFEDEPVYVGLDLAAKNDICSRMLLFRRGNEYYLFSNHYIPEAKTHGADHSHYAGWVHDGHITMHPGSGVDFNEVEHDIRQDAKRFDISGAENDGGEVCADEWNAHQLVTNLEAAGIAATIIPQIAKHLSEPFKELQVLIDEGRFHHDNNPATTWMFGNTTAWVDQNENIKPRKETKGSPNKIDAAAATVNAMARAMYTEIEGTSCYETGDVLAF